MLAGSDEGSGAIGRFNLIVLRLLHRPPPLNAASIVLIVLFVSGCEIWFHMKCVGVEPETVMDKAPSKCCRCHNPK